MNISVVGFGVCETKIFGSHPIDRIERQVAKCFSNSFDIIDQMEIAILASRQLVVSDDLVTQLIEAPFGMLRNRDGHPVAISVPVKDMNAMLDWLESPAEKDYPEDLWREIDWQETKFIRKLRKRQPSLMLTTRELPSIEIERRIFDHAYKGLTDVITKHVWPAPAFRLVKILARLGISPNMVTLFGIALTFVAGYCFWMGDFAAGLAAAWTMTFLDTVDGKLARVTQQSSKIGDILDHATDYIHPPFWWIAVALATGDDATSAIPSDVIWLSLQAILLTYVLGRLVELVFKKRFGMNQYIWEESDGWLRQIIARRNTILLLLSLGFVLTDVASGFVAAAIWSVITIGWQSVRLAQAIVLAHRGSTIQSWIG